MEEVGGDSVVQDATRGLGNAAATGSCVLCSNTHLVHFCCSSGERNGEQVMDVKFKIGVLFCFSLSLSQLRLLPVQWSPLHTTEC